MSDGGLFGSVRFFFFLPEIRCLFRHAHYEIPLVSTCHFVLSGLFACRFAFTDRMLEFWKRQTLEGLFNSQRNRKKARSLEESEGHRSAHQLREESTRDKVDIREYR